MQVARTNELSVLICSQTPMSVHRHKSVRFITANDSPQNIYKSYKTVLYNNTHKAFELSSIIVIIIMYCKHDIAVSKTNNLKTTQPNELPRPWMSQVT